MERFDFRGVREWKPERPRPDHLRYLGPGRIEIVDARGTHPYDPHSLLIDFEGHRAHERLQPIEGVMSVCSGMPAVIFRTNEAEIALTPDEVFRLRMCALTPDEFTAICEAVGATYELNLGNYDTVTGLAQMPYVPVPGYEHLYALNEWEELELVA